MTRDTPWQPSTAWETTPRATRGERGSAQLSADHVEVRCWLVDLGLFQRDGFGRRYVRPQMPPAPFGEAFEALAGLDAGALMASARADDTRKRAERRARFAAEASTKRA